MYSFEKIFQFTILTYVLNYSSTYAWCEMFGNFFFALEMFASY